MESSLVKSLQKLHFILWGQGGALRTVVNREVTLYDSDCVAPSAQSTSMHKQKFAYLDLKAIGTNLCLPCGLQAIIVREAFIEFYGFLRNIPEGRPEG